MSLQSERELQRHLDELDQGIEGERALRLWLSDCGLREYGPAPRISDEEREAIAFAKPDIAAALIMRLSFARDMERGEWRITIYKQDE